MYKLLAKFNWETQTQETFAIFRLSDNACIPFDPANIDYIDFKFQINNETAELENADGVLMTPAEAIAYVATLP